MPSFSMVDTAYNDYLFSTIIIYNVIFSIIPSLANLLISIFIIIKRREYKKRLDLLLFHCYKAKLNLQHGSPTLIESRLGKIDRSSTKSTENTPEHASKNNRPENKAFTNSTTNYSDLDEIQSSANKVNSKVGQLMANYNHSNHSDLYENAYTEESIERFKLNEFDAEFLKTCTPCIAFSLTHAVLFLPYSCVDMINQYKPNFEMMLFLQYMTYARYIFYCCKFYLLILVSYKFRREVVKFFTRSKSKKKTRSSNI